MGLLSFYFGYLIVVSALCLAGIPLLVKKGVVSRRVYRPFFYISIGTLVLGILLSVATAGLSRHLDRRRAEKELASMESMADAYEESDSGEEEEVPEEPQIEIASLYLDFAFADSEYYLDHKVSILIDGEEIDQLEGEPYYTHLTELETGSHVVQIRSEDNAQEHEEEIDLSSDTTLQCTIALNEESLEVDNVNFLDNVDGSAIIIPDLVDMPLETAVSSLESKAFTNFQISSDTGEEILIPEDWEVVEQSVMPGSAIDKNAPIVIICKNMTCQIYFDLSMASNIIFNRYDIDVFMDGVKIGTVKHGGNLTSLQKVRQGDHQIVLYKATDNTVKREETVTLSGDVTFKASLKADSSIEMSQYELIDGISGASMEVVDVVGKKLSQAMRELSECGFINVTGVSESDTKLSSSDSWTVTKQSVAPGEKIDKNDSIVLTCSRTSELNLQALTGQTVADAVKQTGTMGYKEITYKSNHTKSDITDVIGKASDADKKLWVIKRAEEGWFSSSKVALYVEYTGKVKIPDLVGKTSAEAVKALHDLYLYNITLCDEKNTTVYENDRYLVKTQSATAGKEINGNDAIKLICVAKETTSTSSENTKKTETAPPASSQTTGNSGFQVVFIDVGQGDATLISCDGHYMLIDGGDKKKSQLMYTFLKNRSIDYIDVMVGTHPDADHIGGLSGALQQVKVGEAYCSATEHDTDAFRDFVKNLNAQGKSIIVPSAGDSFSLGSSEVTILGPVNPSSESNNNSIVIRVVYGETSFLFTGDAEYDEEKDIIGSGRTLESTVLKVGHHGSKSSTDYNFLNTVSPEYAVISVGKGNSYGHPTEDVLSLLRDADVKTYRTDMQGDITFTSDGKTVTVSTARNADADTLADAGLGQKSNKSDSMATENSIPAYTESKTVPAEEQNAPETNNTFSEEHSPVVETTVPGEHQNHYILNTNSHKFHKPGCRAIKQMNEENKEDYYGTSEEVRSMGYDPCGICNP